MRKVPLSHPVDVPTDNAADASANIASEIAQARSWGRRFWVKWTSMDSAKIVDTTVATNARATTTPGSVGGHSELGDFENLCTKSVR